MNRKEFKKYLILSLCIFLLISSFGCSIRSKGEQTAINDYGMYMSGQYNILKFLQDSLDAKNNRSDFINKLILAKGEFTYLDKIINHVAMPESLKEFHKKGKKLINVALTNASNGKPFNSDISKIEEYIKKLRQMVHELNSIITEDKSASDIYNGLDDLGRRLQLSK